MAIYLIIQDLIAEDVVVVTCAGDDGERVRRGEMKLPDRAPAIWGSRRVPIVVAGAVTNRGKFASFSRGVDNWEDLAWAPGGNYPAWVPGWMRGDGVICAGNGRSQELEGRGTGFAAGMVRVFLAFVPEISVKSTDQAHKDIGRRPCGVSS